MSSPKLGDSRFVSLKPARFRVAPLMPTPRRARHRLQRWDAGPTNCQKTQPAGRFPKVIGMHRPCERMAGGAFALIQKHLSSLPWQGWLTTKSATPNHNRPSVLLSRTLIWEDIRRHTSHCPAEDGVMQPCGREPCSCDECIEQHSSFPPCFLKRMCLLVNSLIPDY